MELSYLKHYRYREMELLGAVLLEIVLSLKTLFLVKRLNIRLDYIVIFKNASLV